MIQVRNTTVSVAANTAAESAALPLQPGEGNDQPVYAPPYEHVPVVRLPNGDDITKALKEQRQREVGSAAHLSAIAAVAATSNGSTTGASLFASLGEPAIALSSNFKPDPLPPIVSDRLSAVALNPQPLPPREALAASQINDPLAAVALNPQPLPPRALATLSKINDRFAAVALNPQPLPPRALATLSKNHKLNALGPGGFAWVYGSAVKDPAVKK